MNVAIMTIYYNEEKTSEIVERTRRYGNERPGCKKRAKNEKKKKEMERGREGDKSSMLQRNL